MATGCNYNRVTAMGTPDPPDVWCQQQRNATCGVIRASSSDTNKKHDICHPNLSVTIAVEIGRLSEEQVSKNAYCYAEANLVSISLGLGYSDAS